MYKLELSDNSYMFVDDSYILVLFHKDTLHPFMEVTILEYLNNYKSNNFVVCDKINDKLIPLNIVNISPMDSNYTDIYGYRLKRVEDIIVGDMVMDPYGNPQEVLEVHIQEGDTYEIETEDGIKHIVNDNHIISLIRDNVIINMTVKDFLSMSEEDQAKYEMWKGDVEYSE